MLRILTDGEDEHRIEGPAGTRKRTSAPADLLESLLRGEALGAVVPVALDAVERDPLASGGHFRGDLLRALMEVPGRFWGRHPQLFDRYQAVVRASAEARRRLPAEQRMSFWEPLPRVRGALAADDADERRLRRA